MASQRQIEANRENARRSTGPRTEGGKAVSRRNATRHGLAGAGGDVAGELAGEFARRREAWGGENGARSDLGRHALDRAVAASLRAVQCSARYDALIVDGVARARLAWEGDRKAEAAATMEGLAKRPGAVVARLEATLQGATLLRKAWGRLLAPIEAGASWSDAEQSRAMDLLGEPTQHRQFRRPIDPRPEGSGGEVDGATRDHRRRLALRERRRLGRLIRDVLRPLDELDRRQAEESRMAPLDGPGRLVLRYERDADRQCLRMIAIARTDLAGPGPAFDPGDGPPRSGRGDDGFEGPGRAPGLADTGEPGGEGRPGGVDSSRNEPNAEAPPGPAVEADPADRVRPGAVDSPRIGAEVEAGAVATGGGSTPEVPSAAPSGPTARPIGDDRRGGGAPGRRRLRRPRRARATTSTRAPAARDRPIPGGEPSGFAAGGSCAPSVPGPIRSGPGDRTTAEWRELAARRDRARAPGATPLDMALGLEAGAVARGEPVDSDIALYLGLARAGRLHELRAGRSGPDGTNPIPRAEPRRVPAEVPDGAGSGAADRGADLARSDGPIPFDPIEANSD